ncbi:hypothetical protein L1277_001940 [Okibacterium sp. HSC-33S16]|uniref:hypothetical protein n=1 Tax=Okibacterium sp. HSC-33S16 TaxID=2910965 RepID=UPI00209C71F0|nr:hypothetical protein [Okibacterium sp. HSC-33S16]MCP2031842.1 hypothetical protein [Okibacterium sp. HSC-33S16]
MRLKRGGLAVGVLLCILVTGCGFGGFGTVCTAIGYINTVKIELVGDVSDVGSVRLCDGDDVCSATDDELAVLSEDEPLVSVQPDDVSELPGSPASPSRSPVPSLPPSTSGSPSTSPELMTPYIVRHAGGADWVVEMPFGSPDEVTISVLRLDGSSVGEVVTDLEWKRVGGTEQCGGPMEAGPVTVFLSA